MHIIDLDKLDEYKNSSNKSFILQDRQVEILEQIRDKKAIDINGKQLSAISCIFVSQRALNFIMYIISHHMYPLESLPYRNGKDYFQKKEILFQRKLANFFYTYQYNVYANLKPFSDEEINQQINQFLDENSVIDELFKEKRALAVKLWIQIKINYIR